MKVKSPIFMGAILLLSGCVGKGVSPKQHLNLVHSSLTTEGKPAGYIDGYMDGCSSGRRLAGDNKFAYRKNNARAEQDALYARGWEDGQINCRNEHLLESQKASAPAVPAETAAVDTHRQRQEEAEMKAIWNELRK